MFSEKTLNNKCLSTTLRVLAVLVATYGLGFRQISSMWTDPFTWIHHEVAARLHFITGPAVLFLGLFQFKQNLRRDRPNVHRWIGRVYVFCNLLSIGSVYAFVNYCAYGTVPVVSLYILNSLWLITICVAVYYIAIKKDVVAHKYWMIRNYALTCSAITLRVILLAFTALGQETAYKIATSNCFVWNMILAELIICSIKRNLKMSQTSPPPSVNQIKDSELSKKEGITNEESEKRSIKVDS